MARNESSLGVRHPQSILIFFGLCSVFMMRVNLSVAIDAMMDRNSTNTDFPEYTWSEQTKSLLLSSFFWGYCITQIPGGQLAKRFGGKLMLLFSIGTSGFLALFTPLSASLGDWQLVCVLRFLQGFFQGVIYPSIHTLLAKWAPPAECGVLATLSFSGAQFGTIIMLATSGTLAVSSYGWPSIFYISGCCGLLWSFVWLFWGYDSPQQCKFITKYEIDFIESELAMISKGNSNSADIKLSTTPWLRISTSLPFWVLIITCSSNTWGYWTIMTQIPTYMKSVLGKDIKSNALLSSLPYVANLLLGWGFCVIAQVLVSSRILSTSASRKIFNTIGMWIPMIAVIALGFVDAQQTDLAIILLTVCVGTNSATFLGSFVNHIDLAPNYAGTLMGITNCAANMMSVIAPIVVGIIVTDTSSLRQWRIVFIVMAVYYLVGNFLFVTLGTTKQQHWNQPENLNKNRDHIKFQVIAEGKENNDIYKNSHPTFRIQLNSTNQSIDFSFLITDTNLKHHTMEVNYCHKDFQAAKVLLDIKRDFTQFLSRYSVIDNNN